MTHETVDAQYEQLLADMNEAVALLRRHNEEQWADWLQGDARRISAGDGYGLQHLLQAFGGMGSLNDVWVAADNESTASSDLNDTLSDLRSRIWTNAQALLRS